MRWDTEAPSVRTSPEVVGPVGPPQLARTSALAARLKNKELRSFFMRIGVVANLYACGLFTGLDAESSHVRKATKRICFSALQAIVPTESSTSRGRQLDGTFHTARHVFTSSSSSSRSTTARRSRMINRLCIPCISLATSIMATLMMSAAEP